MYVSIKEILKIILKLSLLPFLSGPLLDVFTTDNPMETLRNEKSRLGIIMFNTERNN